MNILIIIGIILALIVLLVAGALYFSLRSGTPTAIAAGTDKVGSVTGGANVATATQTKPDPVATAMPIITAIRKIAPGIDTATAMTDSQVRMFLNRSNAMAVPVNSEVQRAYGALIEVARTTSVPTTALQTEMQRAEKLAEFAGRMRNIISSGFPCGMTVDETTNFFRDCGISTVRTKGTANCPSGMVAYTTDNVRDPPIVAPGGKYCIPAGLDGRKPQYMARGQLYKDPTTGTASYMYMTYL